jgi:hypothetical protein
MKCKKINNLLVIKIIIMVIIPLFIVLISIVKQLTLKSTSTTSPVEELKIDSITKDNNKLIIEVKHLDSIKNVKSIEIKSLDNDSTLKLFYHLIGK